ncbi:MAG: GTP 3',8-cyclase MoaA [Candidatus Eremiobacteraeota bacterium]|nr:GTP 3',8-cyclase MoaA [Candidatus Eremiobacteraeota bacterium]
MARQTIDLTKQLADQFRRQITYLRISVTDKCNLRCVYCMPANGLPWIPNPQILTYEEIVKLVEAAATVGVRSVRLTGGEPLVRRDLPWLIRRLNAIDGIEDIALSTNGLLLREQIAELAGAGLRRVNVSLDTLREDRFFAIARRHGLERVLDGVEAALEYGLAPVKLNCVIMRGQNDDEIADFAALTRSRPIFVRFIEMMPVLENVTRQYEMYVSANEILGRLREIEDILPIPGPSGNGPAHYYSFAGSPGAVGVISPISHDYCESCNRVRLSADGRLRLCLFGDYELDFRAALRDGTCRERLVEMLRGSMLIKPERHHLELGKTASAMRAFSQIGG